MQTRVLLSIKPRFAEKIFDGSKRFEFRRKLFRCTDVTHVVVYASSPTQKVIGEFEVAEIISLSPKSLWQRTRNYAGISKQLFDDYFRGRKIGHAIKIKKARRYIEPIELSKAFDVARPPQSFAYIAE